MTTPTFSQADMAAGAWWKTSYGTANRWVGGLYLIFSLTPLVVQMQNGFATDLLTCEGPRRVVALVYGAVVSFAPAVWLWWESWRFFLWSAAKYNPDTDNETLRKRQETRLKEERDLFKVHAEGAKAVWAATIALYAGVLLKFS